MNTVITGITMNADRARFAQVSCERQADNMRLSGFAIEKLAEKGIEVLERTVTRGGRWGFTPIVRFTLLIDGEPVEKTFEECLELAFFFEPSWN